MADYSGRLTLEDYRTAFNLIDDILLEFPSLETELGPAYNKMNALIGLIEEYYADYRQKELTDQQRKDLKTFMYYLKYDYDLLDDELEYVIWEDVEEILNLEYIMEFLGLYSSQEI